MNTVPFGRWRNSTAELFRNIGGADEEEKRTYRCEVDITQASTTVIYLLNRGPGSWAGRNEGTDSFRLVLRSPETKGEATLRVGPEPLMLSGEFWERDNKMTGRWMIRLKK